MTEGADQVRDLVIDLDQRLRAAGHVGPSWGVTELVLFTSVPGRDGSLYEPVHRAALDGR